jgi:hypothetical protein
MAARRLRAKLGRMNSKKNLPSDSNRRPIPPPSRDQIAALAHAIWIDRGCPPGTEVENWLEAERQLRAQGNVATPINGAQPVIDDRALDPDVSKAGQIDRELDRVVTPPGQRSPTSL